MYLEKIRPEANERRFYALEVSEDLFGSWILTRTYGRIGSKGAQRHRTSYRCPAEASHALARIAAAKRRRGYQ